MTRRTFRLFALVLVAFALVASACFQIRVFAMTGSKALAEGESTKFKIDLYRQSDLNDSTTYLFLLVGLDGLTSPTYSNWDLKGNFGGPFGSTGNCATAGKHCNDTALRNWMLASDRCAANGVSATDIESSFSSWSLRRTTSTIDSSSGGFAQRFRMNLFVTRAVGQNNAGGGNIVVFSGAWADGNSDGVPNNGDTWTCTSMVMTGVPFKP